MSTADLIQAQRAFFDHGRTKNLAFRAVALERLERQIRAREHRLLRALRQDLGKSNMEAYMTEIGLTCSELRYIAAHIHRWAAKKWVPTPLSQFPSRSFCQAEPYGVVLVMAPWNYPFLLSMEPLIGALAAGNTVVLKPSAYAPHMAKELEELLGACFPPEYVAVVQGGREANTELLEQRFDYIFFTGSVAVGKLVMERAAAHLTPVTLELGGKSPCIVDRTANVKLAAKRIVFGKFLNAGQTCVAPDYLLVHREVKNTLVAYMRRYLQLFYGKKPLENPDYPKIINEKHFLRLKGLMENQHILVGGDEHGTDKIAPTLLDAVSPDAPVMQEEIFGPILPILTYATLEEAIRFVKAREKPLALYLFTTDRTTEKRVLQEVSFGGGCVNDTVVHLATPYMAFGGVGKSGMGSYHGKKSFDTFSHYKSILKNSSFLDMPVRYPPATARKEQLLRWFLR